MRKVPPGIQTMSSSSFSLAGEMSTIVLISPAVYRRCACPGDPGPRFRPAELDQGPTSAAARSLSPDEDRVTRGAARPCFWRSGHRRPRTERVPDGIDQDGLVDRLAQVSRRALLEGNRPAFHRIVAGDDDDRQQGVDLRYCLLKLEATHLRHAQV